MHGFVHNPDLAPAVCRFSVHASSVSVSGACSSLEDLLCRKEEEVLAALGRTDTLKQRLQVTTCRR